MSASPLRADMLSWARMSAKCQQPTLSKPSPFRCVTIRGEATAWISGLSRLVVTYPAFFSKSAEPTCRLCLTLLDVTSEGRQWKTKKLQLMEDRLCTD